MWEESLPVDVQDELDRRGLNGIPFVVVERTDLSLAGRPGRHWRVATRENVAAVAEGATPEVESHVPVRAVEEFRTQGAMGSGFLQAYVDEHWVDLARYSNAEAEHFARVVRKLEQLRTTGEVNGEEEAPAQVTHCATCGQRLPVAGEGCPRCIPRKAILARLGSMLWPYRWTAAVMCGLMLLAVAAELVPPKLQQYLVDHILHGGAREADVASLGAALLAVVVALAGARVLLSVVNFA